jgi:cytochrome c553
MIACAVLSGTALAQNAPATGDAKAGSQKNAMCIGCHGIPGWRTAYPEVYHVPMIHGQHQAYIVKALQAYRSGERSHPSMRAIAASLSDQDMMNLAAYYGAAAGSPVAPKGAEVTAAPAAPATPTK